MSARGLTDSCERLQRPHPRPWGFTVTIADGPAALLEIEALDAAVRRFGLRIRMHAPRSYTVWGAS